MELNVGGRSEPPKPGCVGAITPRPLGQAIAAPARSRSMPIPGWRNRSGRPLTALDRLDADAIDHPRGEHHGRAMLSAAIAFL